jgi:DNA-binding transcriptional ArsR family regulator
MVKYNTNTLDVLFAALSDPTRRAILERLTQGDATVTDLAEPFDMSLPAVSKHLSVLEDAGLIVKEKNGRTYHCQLNSKPMKDAAAWLERYRRFWESKFDALEQYLKDTNSPKSPEKGKP